MRQALALSLCTWLSSSLWASEVEMPKIPVDCLKGVTEKGYCSETTFPAGGFPFTVRFFVVVEKESYPDVEGLLEKYMAVEQWPAYVESTQSDNIVFNSSVQMSREQDESGSTMVRHYFNYKLKSPIGYQKIRGVTHNVRLAKPYPWSMASIEFAIQSQGPQEVPAGEKPLNGAEGVKDQSGMINATECAGSGLCSESQWLLIYESTINPSISLLPKVVAASVERGLETILVGMLYND